MKKIVILFLIMASAVAGCSYKKEEAMMLKPGTPAYQLAKDLMAILPALDPAKNISLVTTKKFDITASDVIQLIQDSIGNSSSKFKEMNAQQLKGIIEQTAVQFAEQKLLLQAAVDAKSTISPDELKSALDAQYQRAGGEQPFLEMLKSNGLEFDYVKKSIQEDLMIRKYLEGILVGTLQVTDAEIQKVYNEDKTATVRHILLLTRGKSEVEKVEILKKMEDILSRAKKGEDFVALAKQYSEDSSSKENGGLYEDFGRGRMVKPFEDAAFSVPIGQMSNIIETTYGYHILRVENRKKETLPLEQVKSQLEAQIKEQKRFSAFEVHMNKLKDKSKFQINGI